MLECFDVSLQAWLPLFLSTRVTIQNSVMTDESPFDFVEPELVSILHWFCFLAATNDIGMRFKDTDDLFCGRHLLALQDPTSRLIHHLSGTRNKSVESLSQLLRFLLGLLLQLLLGLNRPVNGLLGHVEQFLVLLPACY